MIFGLQAAYAAGKREKFSKIDASDVRVFDRTS
jgi:hypothetical protein